MNLPPNYGWATFAVIALTAVVGLLGWLACRDERKERKIDELEDLYDEALANGDVDVAASVARRLRKLRGW